LTISSLGYRRYKFACFLLETQRLVALPGIEDNIPGAVLAVKLKDMRYIAFTIRVVLYRQGWRKYLRWFRW